MVALEDLFEAYFDCRKHKRKTLNALEFEINYESNLMNLHDEISSRTYRIGKSISFVVSRPKYREVFAADFRDRVVHHLVIMKLEPLFEKYFITDTYSCRDGKSVLFGVDRLHEKMYRISNGFTKDCYLAKFDCKGFFMSINKELLWNKLKVFIENNYFGDDKEEILWLAEMIVLHNPQFNCIRKGHLSDWDHLSKDKSLFTCTEGCGLPIGNLTSQVFANFYLSEFDWWMQEKFHGGYGRYVDDFYIIAEDKNKILSSINGIKEYLSPLGVTLHPDKIYIQHYSKGIKFTGAAIKFGRRYINKSTMFNFKMCIREINAIEDKEEQVDTAISRLNSYLGLCRHYLTYGLRVNIVKQLDRSWHRYIYLTESCEKFVKRNDKTIRKKRKLRSREKVQREQVSHQL